MSDVGVLITLDDESLKDQAVLDYTSRDFTSIRAQLVGLASGIMPDWQTVGEAGDFGTLLVELYAYAADIMNYYIDRTASEAFLATAVRPQSVLYIADMLGYTPIGQSAATVDLSFSMDESPDPDHPLDPVTLPRGTAIHTSADSSGSFVAFETNHPITLSPGDKDKIITATEGVTVNDYRLGTAYGVPNSEFVIRERGVIFGSINVVSQEGYSTVTWTYTSDLSTARPTQSVFTTYGDDLGLTHIVFGDNTSGRIPSVNSKLYASYRYGVGARANNVAEDLITIIVPPKGVDTFFIKVTNPESPIGGSDPETIASMKYTIPRAGARIRSRAVTLNDYADLAMQVASVAKAVAYGTVYTAVKILVAPPDGEATADAMVRLCNTVEQYMTDKVLIGSNVIVGPKGDPAPLFQDVYIRVTVYVVENFNRSSVRDAVDAVITDLLAFDNVDFGTRVSKGAIYRSIMSVQGVEWAEVRWLSPNAPPEDSATVPVSSTVEVGLPVSTTESLVGTKWKFDAVQTIADPGLGEFRVDDFTVVNKPNRLAISNTDASTVPVDVHTPLQSVVLGDHILARSVTDPASWWDLIVSAMVPHGTTAAGWTEYTVTVGRRSIVNFPPTAGQEVLIEFLRYNPTPLSAGEVGDIITDELQIPRIYPTEVIEDITKYPDFIEEEDRTHDGLWVVAVGGLAGT